MKSLNKYTLMLSVCLSSLITTNLFAEDPSVAPDTQYDVFFHFEKLVKGNLIGAYQKSDEKRQEAIDQFMKKCETYQVNARSSGGDNLAYVEDCEGYRVNIAYSVKSSSPVSISYYITSSEENAAPPYENNDGNYTVEMLGYFVHKKVIVDIILPLETKTQTYTKEVALVNPAPYIDHLSSKDDYLLRTYDFVNQKDAICQRLLKSMSAQLGQRLFFTNCSLELTQPSLYKAHSSSVYNADVRYSGLVKFEYWLADM